MGAKCCAGSEAKDAGGDAGALRPHGLPTDEEMVKPASAAGGAAQGAGKVEYQVTLDKATGGSRLGVDVDLSDGVCLIVDKINDGLVGEWNRSNPSNEIRKGDRVVSVNGVSGNAQELAEACKRDDILQLVIERGNE
mmetsp:Transcript_107860/g.287161  ORF Transcript_107860/g.287161 Transcript_107860/m.287161 type:complete len:137 (-) Transcript_107860:282-692(-)|eukprot:CAMPEP_0171202946 /NCGR_PEP_ID=MMETSP0790-20130122/25266_1 /TAXON_ID=2925 /ORGANISM="Alexandrium catenella, Strain OF101" /LENGTH=136 /DNA_ID=CAMNT_0011668389 /DNA_START=107 /DNA_END=517 /DNA_ORIENTATION=+